MGSDCINTKGYKMSTLAASAQSLDLITLQRPHTLVARAAVAVALTVAAWDQRHRTRKHLRNLNVAFYDDIGLNIDDVHAETRKRFWKA